MASCGLNAARQVVIVDKRTAVPVVYPEYPVSADLQRGEVYVLADVLAALADEVVVVVGCKHWPGLGVLVDVLRAWTVEAAGGGRKVRIIDSITRGRRRDRPWVGQKLRIISGLDGVSLTPLAMHDVA